MRPLRGGGNSAFADDVFKDVTSTYLTNADFEGSYEIKSGTGVSSDRAIYAPAGWTVNYSNGQVNDCSALNSSCKQWSFFSSYSSNPSGGNNTYWIRLHKDKKTQQLELSQTILLPLGSYKLTANYLKAESGGEGYIFANNTTQVGTSNNTWIDVSVSFTSNGTNNTKLGCRASHTNSYNKIYAFDNFVLEWNLTVSLQTLIDAATEVYNDDTSNTTLKASIDAAEDVKSSDNATTLENAYNDLATKYALAANRNAWNAAKTAAQSAIDNSTYDNVTGSERTALQTELAKEEPTTADGYNTAKDDLEEATATFTAAVTNYDKYAEERTRAIALGVSSGSIAAMTSASDYTSKLQALIVLEDAAVTDNYTVDVAELLDDWEVSSTAETASNEHWSGSSVSYINKWSGSAFVMDATNTVTLPAGSYVLKAAARAQEGGVNDLSISVKVGSNDAVVENFIAKNGTGYGIDKEGSANYTEADNTYANSNAGYGWEWRFVGFTLDAEASVTLKVNASVKAGKWASFSDYALFTTDDNINYYETLYNNAKDAAEAALDNGTYENVDGAEKKALTDAIAETDPDPDVDWYQDQKTALEEATATFTNATVVANYNRLAAAIAEATAIGTSHTSYDATDETTYTEALTNANALYTAMLNAQKTAKAQGSKVLGFESGQYAPYNNVEVITALAAANAIESVAAASTDELDDAIDGLRAAADWSSANAAEVNAIYDGDFNIQPEHTTGPTTLKGWTAVDGIRQLIKNKTTYPGLDYASQNAAIFTWGGTTITYGAEDGYTLPMGKYVYKLTFKVAGWSDGDLPTEISATLKKGGVTKSSSSLNPNVTERINVAEGNPFKEVSFYLCAPEAGNYTLEITSNKHTVYTDFNLVKATALTINDTDADVLKGFTNEVDITVNRTLVADKWQGFSLPFSLTAGEIAASALNGASIAEFDSDKDNTGTVIYFKEATAIEAGVPYLIKPAEGDNITSMTFTGKTIAAGVEAQTIGEEGDYQFAAQLYYDTSLPTDGTIAYMSTGEGNKVKKLISGGSGIKGTRAYFIIPSGVAPARIVFEGDEVTSIDGTEFIVQDSAKDVYYDLQGRKVTGKPTQRGIYIVNGKKMFVK